MNARPDPAAAELAGRLRDARRLARLSQAEVAAAAGVGRSAVSEIEYGRRSVSALELAGMTRVLGRPVSWFLGESAEVPPPGPCPVLAEVEALVRRLDAGDAERVVEFARFLVWRRAGS